MGDEGEQTELAPADSVTESVRAWGLADFEDEPTVRLTSGRITGAAVAASLVAVTAAGVLAWHLRTQDEPIPTAVTSSMVPATTMAAPVTPVVVAPPPPPPVTIMTIVERVPPPLPVDYNGRFVKNMLAKGWTILDPPLFIQRANRTCELLRQGVPREQLSVDLLKVEPMLNIDMARQFTAAVQDTYPDCP